MVITRLHRPSISVVRSPKGLPSRGRLHRFVAENCAAAGVKLEADLMAKIDEVLAGVIQRDPAQTGSPASRP